MFVADLENGAEVGYDLAAKRAAWVHVVRGAVEVNGVGLKAGDAAAVSGEERVAVRGTDGEASEILLFDLA